MEAALYDPTHGFFATGGGPASRRDFVTSPETGPLFGILVARALAPVDQRACAGDWRLGGGDHAVAAHQEHGGERHVQPERGQRTGVGRGRPVERGRVEPRRRRDDAVHSDHEDLERVLHLRHQAGVAPRIVEPRDVGICGIADHQRHALLGVRRRRPQRGKDGRKGDDDNQTTHSDSARLPEGD
mgnify:CR=1 FL=1